MSELSELMGSLETIPNRRVVVGQDGTERNGTTLAANTDAPERFADMESRADSLFGARAGYTAIKKERPEHRLMLWMKLNGHKTDEISAALGYTPTHVRTVCKQAWFVEAFVRLSTEMGKDAVQTFLKSEVMPALERTVALAKAAESEAVRHAANQSILDRFLGKPIAKVETKTSGSVDVNVRDVAALQEEQRKLDLQLAANGLLINGKS